MYNEKSNGLYLINWLKMCFDEVMPSLQLSVRLNVDCATCFQIVKKANKTSC